ncbi:carboxylesterase family protein [Nocardia fusca]|uniref:carboxylesterase family protein n=1 Tax=Nocardia fusca TaxID=941183 RepID=UPI0037C939D7
MNVRYHCHHHPGSSARHRGRRRAQLLLLPYAAPPLGAGRFAPPAPREPWTGVLDATRPGPTAPQPRRDGFGTLDMSPYFGPGWIRGEDYLTVDIRSPVGAVDCPVMVFVHGGGFVAGSARAPIYDGSAFARDGVVLVIVQYRLGVAGFLDLPGAPRNRGVLDVVAALGWVGRNIAAFGDDPGNVTLFGQSAGATIVGAVIASEAAAGLFRRTIVQSGNGFGAFSPEQGARVTRAAAAALAVAPTVSGFASVSDADLVDVVAALHGLDLRTSTDFDPLLGLSPFGLVAESQPAQSWSSAVDLLIGTNTEEGNLYLVPQGDRRVRPPRMCGRSSPAPTTIRTGSSRPTGHSTRTLPSARCARRFSAMRCSGRAVAGLPQRTVTRSSTNSPGGRKLWAESSGPPTR